jgi:hypothetical protein
MSPVVHVPDVLTMSPAGAMALDSELQSVRAQAALVRSLLDELDELAPPGGRSADSHFFAEQVVEELTHLACRMMETAAAIAPERVNDLFLRRWSALVPNKP